jgi:hypothetical protein
MPFTGDPPRLMSKLMTDNKHSLLPFLRRELDNQRRRIVGQLRRSEMKGVGHATGKRGGGSRLQNLPAVNSCKPFHPMDVVLILPRLAASHRIPSMLGRRDGTRHDGGGSFPSASCTFNELRSAPTCLEVTQQA